MHFVQAEVIFCLSSFCRRLMALKWLWPAANGCILLLPNWCRPKLWVSSNSQYQVGTIKRKKRTIQHACNTKYQLQMHVYIYIYHVAWCSMYTNMSSSDLCDQRNGTLWIFAHFLGPELFISFLGSPDLVRSRFASKSTYFDTPAHQLIRVLLPSFQMQCF